ncbi:TPA: LPXTG cell wall anchor domain-containing protein [Streptococcus suis]
MQVKKFAKWGLALTSTLVLGGVVAPVGGQLLGGPSVVYAQEAQAKWDVIVFSYMDENGNDLSPTEFSKVYEGDDVVFNEAPIAGYELVRAELVDNIKLAITDITLPYTHKYVGTEYGYGSFSVVAFYKPVETPPAETKPVEKPTEKPAEQPVETPAETKPVEQPVEQPAETKPVEQPVEKPIETPTEQPTEKPATTPTEQPAEKPVQQPVEQPTEQPAEKPVETPTEKTAEQPAETKPVEQPVETSTDQPTEKPTATSLLAGNTTSKAQTVATTDKKKVDNSTPSTNAVKSEEGSQATAKTLPKTGDSSSMLLVLGGFLSGLSGLGLAATSRKKD